MAQPDQISVSSRDHSAAAASSSSNHTSFPVREEYDHDHDQLLRQLEFRQPEIEQQQQEYIEISNRGNYFGFNDVASVRDDTWSCVVVVLTFWFFGLYLFSNSSFSRITSVYFIFSPNFDCQKLDYIL